MANNDNKVKMEVDLGMSSESLQKLKASFDDAAKSYEASFKKARSARAKGGRFAPDFLLADEDLKAADANVRKAKDAYLREVEDVRRKSQTPGQRLVSMADRLWFGDRVDERNLTPEQRERRDEARQEQRQSRLVRRMAHMMTLVSSVGRVFAPLPGGGVLHSGLSGLATGFSEGILDSETGERRKGLRGLAGGLAGGLRGAVMGAGLVLAAKGVTGAIEGGRADEAALLSLSQQAGGDVGEGRRALREAYRAPGMTRDEAAPFIGRTLRAGGSSASARDVLRAQLTSGLGNEYVGLLGELARGGANTQGQVDANAKRLWVDILTTGTAQGLQKGRIGELIIGAQQQLANRALGTTSGDAGGVFRLAAFLGQNEAFKGAEGFKMMSTLNSLVTGQAGPLARSLSLMQSGLGSGTGLVEAMRRSERGLFNDDSPEAIGRITDMVRRFSTLGGGDRDLTSLLLSRGGNMPINAADRLQDLVAGGGFDRDAFEKLRESTMTDEQKAYRAMIGAAGDWKHIDQLLDAIKSSLGGFFKDLGGGKALIEVLTETRDAVRELRAFFNNFARGYSEGGLAGAFSEALSGGATKRHQNDAAFSEWVSKNLPAGSHTIPGGFNLPEGSLQRARASMGFPMGAHAAHESFYRLQDKEQKFHFVIEMRDKDNNLLSLQELRAYGTSRPAQSK